MPHRPEPSDEDLVRRVRAGDATAATALFERHLPALRAKARARLPAALRGRVAESDVIQEAYLAAFVSLAEFEDRGDGSFARWLKKILEHKLLDEVKRHARAGRDARREERLATGAESPRADLPTPSAEVRGAEEATRLRATIDGLPEDHATVLRLVHFEGLTLVAAGMRMGRSPDATRMLYGRAMDKLADRLAAMESSAG